VKPMLASVTAGVADAAAKMRGGDDEKAPVAFLAEHKYDGVRAQIHLWRRESVFCRAPCLPGDETRYSTLCSTPETRQEEAFSVRVFSRNCEDRTEAFPDVVRAFAECAKGGDYGDGLVIDAEIVSVDRATGKLLPFQTLASRPRSFPNGFPKEKENAVAETCVFVFDLLYAGDAGESRTNEKTHILTHDLSLRERRSRLRRALPGLGAFPGVFELARSVELRTNVLPLESLKKSEKNDRPTETDVQTSRHREETLEGRIERFMLDAVDAACEGLVLKRLDGARSAYAPSARAESWLKLKREYCETLGGAPRDSLDLVPIGAWHGNGRKAGWYSPFLLAAYDPETETYSSVCRCMSGFSDAFYAEKTKAFGESARRGAERRNEDADDEKKTKNTPRKPPIPAWANTLERPDVWFVPSEVWEVRGADLTLSPKHRAAAGARHAERGISLRFPRFVAERRDKSPEDASGPAEVLALFDAQARRWGGQEAAAERRLRDIQRVREEAPDAFGEEDDDESEEEETSASGE
jgi:DNA ligase 1